MTARRFRLAQLIGALAVLAVIVFLYRTPRPAAPPSVGSEPVTLTVYAAASLTDVVTELSAAYEERHPSLSIDPVFSASSTLARQIEGGARPDLFLSANTEWMDRLERDGLIDTDTRVDALGNELVIVGPAGAPSLPGPEALAGNDVSRVALADPEAVPAGRYARQALEALGLWEAVSAKLVIASDVRVALAYAERGEVDAAIVYRTDARVTPHVEELTTLPDDVQPDIRYAFARCRETEQPDQAQALLDWLTGPFGRSAFVRYGFVWREGVPEGAEAELPAPARPTWHDDWRILRLSLLVSSVAVLIALPFGVGTGWLLARKRFFGKSVVENVANLPLVLPPAVTGFVLLVLFGRHGPVGTVLEDLFGVQVAFTWVAAALAAAAVSFPLLVQSVRVACEAVDPELEAAARTLGASPWRVARTITLPLAAPGIVAGAVIAFARALGELGATLVFAGNTPGQTQTLPLAVWTRVSQVGGEAAAMRLVVLSVAVSYVSLFLASRLHRRTLERRWGTR